MKKIILTRNEWTIVNPKSPIYIGGFGRIFSGKNDTNENVAIKEIEINLGEKALREISIVDSLVGREFSNVIPVFDTGTDLSAGRAYIVMAFADSSLDEYITSTVRTSEDSGISILLEIANGLNECSDLIHRDLKPKNVLLHEGSWKITDFGLARIAENATSELTWKGFGTKEYAAPEQWMMEGNTSAIDVYALGCIGYAVMKGQPPFRGSTDDELKRMHLYSTPDPLNLKNSRLESAIMMALRKDPRDRPTLDRFIAAVGDAKKN